MANNAWNSEIDTALGLFVQNGDVRQVQRDHGREVVGDPMSAPPVPRRRSTVYGAPAGAVAARTTPAELQPRGGPPKWLPSLLLVLPSLIALGIFVYGFIGWNVRVSFTSWRGLTPTYDFVGSATTSSSSATNGGTWTSATS